MFLYTLSYTLKTYKNRDLIFGWGIIFVHFESKCEGLLFGTLGVYFLSLT